MSKTYFIGDTHFGHNGISAKFRTHFPDDDTHHQLIHNNILDCSGKRNDLYLMGDIAFKIEYFDWIKTYTDRFRNVRLFLGNHDHKSLAAFASDNGVLLHGILKKYGYWLSHCPIHPQEQYRSIGNIHGHTHKTVITKRNSDDQEVIDPYYINVSCEHTNYAPISLEKIREKGAN